MLIPRPAFRPNGMLTAHFSNGVGIIEHTGGRVVAIDRAIATNPLPQKIGDLLHVYGLVLPVVGYDFPPNCYYCVPCDARGALEVQWAKTLNALSDIELALARFCQRKGWLVVEEGALFQWRDLLPFMIARWK